MIDYRPLRRFPGSRKDHDRVVQAVCQECSVGCGVLAYVQGNRIVDIQGDERHPISAGRLCAKGIAFVQAVESPERITVPVTRDSVVDPFDQIADWEKALDALADRLRKARERHGPSCLAIGCDPEAGLDFLYGARRFAGLWGTNFVFDAQQVPTSGFLPAELISPSPACRELLHSRVCFIVESDLASTHPVAWRWISEAQDKGASVIVADSRFTATMSKANMFLKIKPQAGNLLGMILAKMALDKGQIREEVLQAAFTDPKSWQDSFSPVQVSEIAQRLGISPQDPGSLEGLVEAKGPVTVITGRNLIYRRGHGIWLTLSKALEWEEGGGGWYPLDAGHPQFDVIGDLEGVDQSRLEWTSGDPSELAASLIEEEASGNRTPVKALITTGDCLRGFLSPFSERAAEMDVVAHFGSFHNGTTRRARMAFPCAQWAEREGLCFSGDRTIQWAPKLVESDAGCKVGLDFWTGLAQRFGWEEAFPWAGPDGGANQAAFADWLLGRSSRTREITTAHLMEAGEKGEAVRWPNHGAQILPSPKPGDASLVEKIDPTPATELPLQPDAGDERFPLYFHSTAARFRETDSSVRWSWVAELGPDGLIQINPETAEALGIENGDEVVVEGAKRSAEAQARLSRVVSRGMVSAPLALEDRWVLVRKKGENREKALTILTELLQ